MHASCIMPAYLHTCRQTHTQHEVARAHCIVQVIITMHYIREIHPSIHPSIHAYTSVDIHVCYAKSCSVTGGEPCDVIHGWLWWQSGPANLARLFPWHESEKWTGMAQGLPFRGRGSLSSFVHARAQRGCRAILMVSLHLCATSVQSSAPPSCI